MPNLEIELNPIDFITIGTIGPKGQRVFYLQAGQGMKLVSMIIEKEQSWALSEAIKELMDELDSRIEDRNPGELPPRDMDLREPIEPVFRISQLGLGYDEEQDKIVLVAQELITDDIDDESVEPSIVRIWCSRKQIRALSDHAMDTVRAGRADPKQNGSLVYYWM
ncbi:MAG: DUF3090 domain-containing protein [Phototrophicales bacterium]|nr:MAG: DUF3090 domain-containing protein [Phototrophicales bacterium]